MRIGIVAGKFDPIMEGHVSHIMKASRLCDYLIIVTHKDDIVARVSEKKFCAVPLDTRILLLRGLLMACNIGGGVLVGIDEDGTMVKMLRKIRAVYPHEPISYIKGGDRTPNNMDSREIATCETLKIKVEYGVGDLLSSSSKTMMKLNEVKQIFMFDIDNTFVKTEGTDYPNSQPIQDMVDRINRLYDMGNTIKITTSRGSRSGKDWHDLTLNQLKQWGIKYHELIMNKPFCDHYIGDEVMTIENFKERM
jgi:cytidyltransferase-like protein